MTRTSTTQKVSTTRQGVATETEWVTRTVHEKRGLPAIITQTTIPDEGEKSPTPTPFEVLELREEDALEPRAISSGGLTTTITTWITSTYISSSSTTSYIYSTTYRTRTVTETSVWTTTSFYYQGASATVTETSTLYNTVQITTFSETLTESGTTLIRTTTATLSEATNDAPPAETTTASSAGVVNTPSEESNGGMTTATKVGVGVGGGLAGIAALAGLIWCWKRKRDDDAMIYNEARMPQPYKASSVSTSPMSQTSVSEPYVVDGMGLRRPQKLSKQPLAQEQVQPVVSRRSSVPLSTSSSILSQGTARNAYGVRGMSPSPVQEYPGPATGAFGNGGGDSPQTYGNLARQQHPTAVQYQHQHQRQYQQFANPNAHMLPNQPPTPPPQQLHSYNSAMPPQGYSEMPARNMMADEIHEMPERRWGM